ncbi:MAG: zinc-binding alcohol dehydrogenase family protein [Anaerotignaceae bacterium]
MKALIINSPNNVSIGEIEKPIRKKGEALLKLLYGGICGSDLGSFRGTNAYVSYPRVPGHEFSAEIVEIDENPYGLEAGMIVTANPYFNCGSCYSCQKGKVNVCTDNQTMGVQREGGFSEYITMPIERIYAGKGLDGETLALIEPFCISYHGISRADVQTGDKVLIMGAGTIGVLAAIAAKTKGAEVTICDVAQEKLKYAYETFGIDHMLLNSSPEDFTDGVEKLTNGNGFDVTIEAVGLPVTFQNCIDAVCFGGKVVLIGVSKRNIDDFFFTIIQKKELNIYGSRNALKEDFDQLIDLVQKNNINLNKIITNRYNFNEGPKALEDFANNADKMLKVVLDFTK